MTLSRRALGASALTTMAWPRLTRAADDSVDVAVIGAGLSGLNAAWILTEAGYSVAVLDGADRFGGRVWSATDVETKPELGASQIGASYARVLDAVDRLGLKLIDEDRDILPFTYYLDGQFVEAKDWADHPANRTVGDERKIGPVQLGSRLLSKLMPFKELDDWLSPDFAKLDVSIGQLFEQAGYSPEARRLAQLTQDARVSALGMMQEMYRGTYESKFSNATGASMPMRARDPAVQVESAVPTEHWPKNVVGGCWQLPKAMAGKLNRPVMTGKLVTAVDMDRDGVDVRCLDGSRVRAKFAISAVPFATLRQVAISPTPDSVHSDAINDMGYAETTRAFGLVKEPFWQDDGFSPSLFTDRPLRMIWMLDNHKNGKGPYRCMFVMQSMSGAQVATLAPDRAAKYLVDEIERIRPAAKGQFKILKFHSWERQPLQRGCRHMFMPGQVTRFGVGMIEPIARLHFAGEHTRRLDYGMESAMESGERAAQEVLARL